MNLGFKFVLAFALVAFGARQTPVPVDQEPNHHVVFSNAYVRVIDASIGVGKATLLHTHAADNVPVVISGGSLRTEVVGGKTTESKVQTGGAWFAKGGYSHRISNIGETPVRFIDAEVLDSPPETESVMQDEIGKGLRLVAENERVRIFELKLEPNQTSGVIAFARPVLSVEVSGGKTGEQAVDPTDSQILMHKAKKAEFVWHDRIRREVITNEGTKVLDSIYIEWK